MNLGGPTGHAINLAGDLGPRSAHVGSPLAGKRGFDGSYSWIWVVGPIIGGATAATIWLRAIGPARGSVIGPILVLEIGLFGSRLGQDRTLGGNSLGPTVCGL